VLPPLSITHQKRCFASRRINQLHTRATRFAVRAGLLAQVCANLPPPVACLPAYGIVLRVLQAATRSTPSQQGPASGTIARGRWP